MRQFLQAVPTVAPTQGVRLQVPRPRVSYVSPPRRPQPSDSTGHGTAAARALCRCSPLLSRIRKGITRGLLVEVKRNILREMSVRSKPTRTLSARTTEGTPKEVDHPEDGSANLVGPKPGPSARLDVLGGECTPNLAGNGSPETSCTWTRRLIRRV